MSLFPAYAQDVYENKIDYEECSSASSALEAQLLASDNDEEREPLALAATPRIDTDEYYFDCKFDCGNLRVSTLYYPGRPQGGWNYGEKLQDHEEAAIDCEAYEVQRRGAVGAGGGARRQGRAQRYWERPPDEPALDADAEAELGARVAVFRRALADRPADERLWLDFIDFQERCRDAAAALAVAAEASAAGRAGPRVRAALYRLREAALPVARRRALLRDELAVGHSPELKLELWLRLLEEVARSGSAAELDAAAGAALAATRALPCAYPHILYQYGGYLRAAGLWERLVLLLELALAMNFPPSAFPPAVDFGAAERQLQLLEDKAVASGLPLSTVWARVERARAAVHWRPAAAPDPADPQRAPLAADVAELLLPAHARAQLPLLVQALRLAKVPLLPASGYALRGLLPSNTAAGDGCGADCAEALLAHVRAARRLPAAHAARAAAPEDARAALAPLLEPPHYFSDDAGYLSWVNALWDASCGWTQGEERAALLCWRLRWLHALALLAGGGGGGGNAAEARRLRAEARGALKRWAGDAPLPYAHFARLERAVAGPARARRAALHAVRAALRERAAPPEHRLYAARVLSELCDEPPRDWAGAWASACAALGAALPADDELARPPPPELLSEALLRCERACDELEARLAREEPPAPADADGAQFVRAQLPHAAEWAAARARLAPPPRRAELLTQAARAADRALGAEAARYWEQAACALAVAAARDQRMLAAARALAPLHPHNALLALACGGDTLWARQAGAVARTHTGALALALPALLRAARSAGAGAAPAALAAAAARAARGGAGGGLLRTLRVEAEARAPALLAAVDALPNHKWLYVRGAAWSGADAAALHDALLERELRVHALRDELAPPAQ